MASTLAASAAEKQAASMEARVSPSPGRAFLMDIFDLDSCILYFPFLNLLFLFFFHKQAAEHYVL